MVELGRWLFELECFLGNFGDLASKFDHPCLKTGHGPANRSQNWERKIRAIRVAGDCQSSPDLVRDLVSKE